MTFTYGAKGLALTKQFEGLRLKAYEDVGGIWTIGYGHTGPQVVSGLLWTLEQADAQLIVDTHWAQQVVNSTVNAKINQNQNDAMVDFVFNCGSGNFLTSTLRSEVNEGFFDNAVSQFGLWVHADGVVIPDLVRRRQAEATLFAEAA